MVPRWDSNLLISFDMENLSFFGNVKEGHLLYCSQGRGLQFFTKTNKLSLLYLTAMLLAYSYSVQMTTTKPPCLGSIK